MQKKAKEGRGGGERRGSGWGRRKLQPEGIKEKKFCSPFSHCPPLQGERGTQNRTDSWRCQDSGQGSRPGQGKMDHLATQGSWAWGSSQHVPLLEEGLTSLVSDLQSDTRCHEGTLKGEVSTARVWKSSLSTNEH